MLQRGLCFKQSLLGQEEMSTSNGRDAMTPEEQITKMTGAIKQALKVMGDRFGSTEGDVSRT